MTKLKRIKIRNILPSKRFKQPSFDYLNSISDKEAIIISFENIETIKIQIKNLI